VQSNESGAIENSESGSGSSSSSSSNVSSSGSTGNSSGNATGGPEGTSNISDRREVTTEGMLATAAYKHRIDSSRKAKAMSELVGLYNEVDIDVNCEDVVSATSESGQVPVYHPRPRPDRREVSSKGSSGAPRTEVSIRVSLHSTALSGGRSAHTGIENFQCKETKELEYELIGSNTLLDLKECIYCVQDAVNGAPQVNVEQPSRQHAMESETSYFFIEGVFYINEPEEYCSGLTRDMRAWQQSHSQIESQTVLGEAKEQGLSDSSEDDINTTKYYIRAAKWVIGLVEAEKQYASRCGQKRSRPIPNEDDFSEQEVSNHKLTEEASQTLAPSSPLQVSSVAHHQGQGLRHESPARVPMTDELDGEAIDVTTSPRKKGQPKKAPNRKPNIAPRFAPCRESSTECNTIDCDSASVVTFKSMKTTKLANLKFRLGVRYLYSHINACEHFLYFSDVHLHSFDDSSGKAVHGRCKQSLYPKLLYRGHMRRRLCGVCNLWSAKCVVFDDRLTSDNPTFFCQHCYHLLHYDHQGDLLYDDFQVFPYLHDMV